MTQRSLAARRLARAALGTDVVGDVLYALRTLRAAPAFTLAAIATLGLGIGATTAIFSVVDGVLLKPLPFSHPDRVVALFQDDRTRGLDHEDVAPANFVDWRERTRSFSALAAAEPFALTYTGPDGVEEIFNWNVTRGFFAALDARPVLGRLFVPEDFTPGPPRVLILTYASWRGRFGGDPGIIGRRLQIGRGFATVVGVLPANFDYQSSSKMEIYAPKVLSPGEQRIRNISWLHVVGRLRRGVSLDQARADARRVGVQLGADYPATNATVGVTVEPLAQAIVGDAGRAVTLLFGAVVMVLLIACVNVANLVVTRSARRRREMAIRTALGASRARIARQLLTEHLLIACAGGLAGVAGATWTVRVIRSVSPLSVPRLADMRVDARALAVTLATVVIATLIFGLLPALRSARVEAVAELRAGSRASGDRSRGRLRRALVVAEVALAVVLLTGAGLLTRSFLSVVRADRGYVSDHVLAASVFVYRWNPTPRSQVNFIRQLVARAAMMPGVVAAGATSSLPLDIAIGADRAAFTIDGRSVRPGEEPSVHVTAVTPGALATLRIARHRGRQFTFADDSGSIPVAIVNETMARRYWPGADPLGRHLRFAFNGPSLDREIVGVVADTRQTALDAPPEPIVYVPLAQAPTGAMSIVLRTASEPRSVLRAFERAVAELNPELPLANVQTLDELAAASVKPRRFMLLLFGAFSACAIALALVGVFAVINQGVAERRAELAVRIAVGARPRDVVRTVLVQGLLPAVEGVAAGIGGAVTSTALLRTMLVGVPPLDAPTFAGVGALMIAAAVLACVLPARRASRVDPLDALRAG